MLSSNLLCMNFSMMLDLPTDWSPSRTILYLILDVLVVADKLFIIKDYKNQG